MRNEQPGTTQKRLRQLAQRTLRIVERQKEMNSSITPTLAGTVIPAARAFIDAYDSAARYQSGRGQDMDVGRRTMAELQRLTNASAAIVRRIRPEFDSRLLTGSAEIPDSLISDGRRLIEVLGDSGVALPQIQVLLDGLTAAVEKAETEWHRNGVTIPLSPTNGVHLGA